MTSYVQLHLPPKCVVKGGIPTSREVEDLDSDMVEVRLPDGATVECGWVPSHDPAGRYRIVLFQTYWSHQLAPQEFRRTPEEAASVLCRLAWDRYRKSASPAANTVVRVIFTPCRKKDALVLAGA